MNNLTNVVIDLDVGLDDATALFIFLYAQILGKIKIEALTCVHGNTDVDHVIVNVIRMLEISNSTDVSFYEN